MSINDLPILSALRTKMQWHQERQRVLAENVSNSDTPEFQAARSGRAEIRQQGSQPSAGAMGSLAMMRTSAEPYRPVRRRRQLRQRRGKSGFQTRPAGNAVNLEDQMLKVSANQMDYAAATSLYSRSLHFSKPRSARADAQAS